MNNIYLKNLLKIFRAAFSKEFLELLGPPVNKNINKIQFQVGTNNKPTTDLYRKR